MIPRAVPPVHSPATLGSILRGLGRRLGRDERTEVRSLLLRQYGARDLVLTDSGTTALTLAIRQAVARRPECTRVALPAWGCYDLATAVDGAGISAVLYDLDPATLGPDGSSLDRALAAGVAAVVVVHFFGVPVDVSGLAARAARAGAIVIEDAAQAVGTEVGGRPAGAAGDLGVLSFGRGKGWTGGGGGALLLNPSADPTLVLPPAGSLPAVGGGAGSVVKLLAQWVLARPACYALPSALPFLQLGQTVYHPPSPPAALSPIQASLLLTAVPLLAKEAESRRAHAARLRQAIEGAGSGSNIRPWEGGGPGWLRLPFRAHDAHLARCRTAEARRLGIMPGYPTSLARLRGFTRVLHSAGDLYQGAEDLAVRLHTVPTHSQLGEEDLLRLERWLGVANR